MSQLFLVNNLIKKSVITASSENAQFPASNLKDDRRSKVFRSTESETSIVFDFGSILEVDSFMSVASGYDALGFTTIRLELAINNDFSFPLVSQYAEIDQIFGIAKIILETPVNARFARLVINNSDQFCQLSKTFIGKFDSIGDLCFTYPVQYSQKSNARVTKNELGQRFVDEINSQKTIQGSFETLTKDEVDSILSILDDCSITKPFFLVFPEGNITNNNNRLNGYYYLQSDPDLVFDAGNYWSLTLSMEEGA
jgi:hypothetical protein